jgi:hypothetical protein
MQGLMSKLFSWATESLIKHVKKVCPLCHVGSVVVEEMEDEWDDPIVEACTECGHK